MKLSDIEKTSSNKINEKMREKLGWSLKLEAMTPRAASAMMESIDKKLSAVRSSHKIHASQNDPSYVGMIMAKQVLESFVAERKDPDKHRKLAAEYQKLTGKKAPAGTSTQSLMIKVDQEKRKSKKVDESELKVDEKAKAKIASKNLKGKEVKIKETTKKTTNESRRLYEDELGQAQAMLAAKDMVDSMQDMIEDISKMLNEQLPPLTDSIRTAIGSAEADGFKASASSTLSSLLTTVQTSRDAMDQAVRTLSGEPSTVSVPGAGADPLGGAAGMDPLAGGDEAGLGLPDGEDDDFGASDVATGGDLPLGREKR